MTYKAVALCGTAPMASIAAFEFESGIRPWLGYLLGGDM